MISVIDGALIAQAALRPCFQNSSGKCPLPLFLAAHFDDVFILVWAATAMLSLCPAAAVLSRKYFWICPCWRDFQRLKV